MPIKHHLLKTAAKSYIRTRQLAPYSGEELQTDTIARISHRTWIEGFMDDLELTHLYEPLDTMALHRKWDRAFRVDMDSMNTSRGLAGKPKFLADLDAFTDGSKETSTQDTGAGF